MQRTKSTPEIDADVNARVSQAEEIGWHRRGSAAGWDPRKGVLSQPGQGQGSNPAPDGNGNPRVQAGNLVKRGSVATAVSPIYSDVPPGHTVCQRTNAYLLRYSSGAYVVSGVAKAKVSPRVSAATLPGYHEDDPLGALEDLWSGAKEMLYAPRLFRKPPGAWIVDPMQETNDAGS